MGGAVSSGRDNNELVDNLMGGNYIRTAAVERVFRALDRADYMTREFRDQAYKDLAWRHGPLHLSAPCIYSEVMEGLELKPGLSFLNVGSGTGYLSTMVGLILGCSGISHGVELVPAVVEYANKRLGQFMANSAILDELDFCEPRYFCGNGLRLAPPPVGYDRVYVGASCPDEFQYYFKQLIKVGGILMMPLNDNLVQVRRMSATEWTSRSVLNVSFATLRVPSEQRGELLVLEEQTPVRLTALCRGVVRGCMRTALRRRHPELCEPPPRAPPAKRQCPRRICIPVDGDSDEGLNALHDLDRAGGAAEMNALLSLVLSMGTNRAGGALRVDALDSHSDTDDDDDDHATSTASNRSQSRGTSDQEENLDLLDNRRSVIVFSFQADNSQDHPANEQDPVDDDQDRHEGGSVTGDDQRPPTPHPMQSFANDDDNTPNTPEDAQNSHASQNDSKTDPKPSGSQAKLFRPELHDARQSQSSSDSDSDFLSDFGNDPKLLEYIQNFSKRRSNSNQRVDKTKQSSSNIKETKQLQPDTESDSKQDQNKSENSIETQRPTYKTNGNATGTEKPSSSSKNKTNINETETEKPSSSRKNKTNGNATETENPSSSRKNKTNGNATETENPSSSSKNKTNGNATETENPSSSRKNKTNGNATETENPSSSRKNKTNGNATETENPSSSRKNKTNGNATETEKPSSSSKNKTNGNATETDNPSSSRKNKTNGNATETEKPSSSSKNKTNGNATETDNPSSSSKNKTKGNGTVSDQPGGSSSQDNVNPAVPAEVEIYLGKSAEAASSSAMDWEDNEAVVEQDYHSAEEQVKEAHSSEEEGDDKSDKRHKGDSGLGEEQSPSSSARSSTGDSARSCTDQSSPADSLTDHAAQDTNTNRGRRRRAKRRRHVASRSSSAESAGGRRGRRGDLARRNRLSTLMKRGVKELPLPYELKRFVNFYRIFQF